MLTAAELGCVLKVFRDHEPQHYPLAATLALTGLRYGEATALRWGDLDEAAGLIRVRRAQWDGIVGTTKTGSVRSVPLVSELGAVLGEHRKKQGSPEPSAWIFPASDGGLLPKCSLRHPLERVLKLAGVTKRVTTHGLRRTFNNLSRQVAGDIVTRSITGHVTEAMTEHYSHVGIDEKLRAASNIVRLVPGLSSTPTPQSGGSGGGSKDLIPNENADPVPDKEKAL